MNVSGLFSGPHSYSESLKLGPLDAAVLLKNGRVNSVRRSGKYRRVFSRDPLGAFGDIDVMRFHTGRVVATASVNSVPLMDLMSIGCLVDLELRLVDRDGVLIDLASEYSPQSFQTRLTAELGALTKKLVFEGMSMLQHGELQRSGDLENLFRSGNRLVDEMVEVTRIVRVTPRWDEAALAEVQAQKQHRMAVSQKQRDLELKRMEIRAQREIEHYEAETKVLVDSVREEGRARIAVKIAQELGVPPWWVYNPDAYQAEIAANQKLLVKILAEHGSEFGMLAEQFGLTRDDFLRVFNGLQRSVADSIQASGATAGDFVLQGSDAPAAYQHAASVRKALESLAIEAEVAASSAVYGAGQLRVVLVSNNVGAVREQLAEIESALVSQFDAFMASIVVAPFDANSVKQVDSVVQSILAEAGGMGTAKLEHRGANRYRVLLDEAAQAVLPPWRPVVERLFKPEMSMDLGANS